MKVVIYTDGGCVPNPGRGGWAALIRYPDREVEIFGMEPLTTNNRMELTAAIKALELLSNVSEAQIFTDSEYLKKGITEWLPNSGQLELGARPCRK
jgi:ribonuclease HI